MADREREKDRCSRPTEAGSMWIDFVLLPGKLEQHLCELAAGTVSTPSPTELIVMFLDQALVSHKAVSGTAGRDDKTAILRETEATVVLTSVVGKTAAVLCERAAKVAVFTQLTLSDIEAIPSQQHQILLLKALVKYDKDRSVVHDCDLHRWIIHNAVRSYPVGFAAPNAVSPVPSLSSWMVNIDSNGVQNATTNAKPDVQTCGSYTSCITPNLKEENASISFLESVLREDEEGVDLDSASNQSTGQDTDKSRNWRNEQILKGGLTKHSCLSKGYRCQVMLDVAEIHFMRGRIRQAHDMFSKGGQLLAELVVFKEAGDGDLSSTFPTEQCPDWNQYALVQRERVAGFIMACRMVLGMHKFMGLSELAHLEGISLGEPPLTDLNAPSPAEQAVIVCEQSRWLLRTVACKDNFSELGIKKLSPGAPMSHRNMDSLHLVDHSSEQDSERHDRTGHAHPQNQQQTVTKSSEWVVEGAGCTLEEESKLHAFREEFSPRQVKKTSTNFLYNSKTLKEHPLMWHENTKISETFAQENISWTFFEDLMKTDLAWDYRLSLEKDISIPVSLRCQLIACNLVQDILAGACAESFLLVSDHFHDSKNAAEFLMRMIAAVLKKLEDHDESRREFEPHENQQLTGSKLIRSRKRKSNAVGNGSNGERASHLREFVKFVCCVLDKPWCWTIALDSSLLTDVQVRSLRGCSSNLQAVLPVDAEGQTACLVGSSEGLSAVKFSMSALSQSTLGPSSQHHARNNIGALFQVMQAESLSDFQDHFCLLGEDKRSPAIRLQQDVSGLHLKSSGELTKKLDCGQVLQTCICGGNLVEVSCEGFTSERPVCHCGRHAITMASVLRQKAFDVVDSGKHYKCAVHIYKLLRLMKPKDMECDLMLWLLGRLDREHDQQQDTDAMDLPEKSTSDTFPGLGLLEYIFVKLFDNEYWAELFEFCKWVAILVEEQLGGGGEQIHLSTFHPGVRELRLMVKVATLLGKLMHMSIPLQTIPICSEEVTRLAPTLWQLFEEFLQCIIGADPPVHKDSPTSDTNLSQGNHAAMAHSSLYQSVRAVPLVTKLSNPKTLMCLGSLTAGWLQRYHLARLTPWPFDVERYGALACAMGGASLPPLFGAATAHRNVTQFIPPGFCRELFRFFLERLVSFPSVVEGGRKNGHVWLQGLADLASEDDDHIKALQYYLQAGAIRSAHYCVRELSMPQDVFTPWVIERMIRACRASGARLQGVILCQCLPDPDYDTAYHILQENLLIMEQDMNLYSECLWEVPILELLINMHTKAGDESRVNYLINLLQQPALNSHNPPTIRQAHVEILKQRFLQRFYDEIC